MPDRLHLTLSWLLIAAASVTFIGLLMWLPLGLQFGTNLWPVVFVGLSVTSLLLVASHRVPAAIVGVLGVSSAAFAGGMVWFPDSMPAAATDLPESWWVYGLLLACAVVIPTAVIVGLLSVRQLNNGASELAEDSADGRGR